MADKMYMKLQGDKTIAYRYGDELQAMALLVDGGYSTEEEAMKAWREKNGGDCPSEDSDDPGDNPYTDFQEAMDFLDLYRHCNSENLDSDVIKALDTILPLLSGTGSVYISSKEVGKSGKIHTIPIRRELDKDTLVRDFSFGGRMFSLHVTRSSGEVIVTDTQDYSKIFSVLSIDFFNMVGDVGL